jgi:hypothetical protein
VILAPAFPARARLRNARYMGSRAYRLTLEGELSDRAARAFEGMTLTRENGTTVLRGRVRDQAELQGLLQRVTDLGLTLLSATALEDDDR